MFGTIMHGPGDVRFEQVEDLKILKPTDAIIKLSVTCVCGSDLWPYRGLQPNEGPAHMGHEYCGLLLTPLTRSDRMKGEATIRPRRPDRRAVNFLARSWTGWRGKRRVQKPPTFTRPLSLNHCS